MTDSYIMQFEKEVDEFTTKVAEFSEAVAWNIKAQSIPDDRRQEFLFDLLACRLALLEFASKEIRDQLETAFAVKAA